MPGGVAEVATIIGDAMNTLILIALGLMTGLFASKSKYHKIWDLVLGALGTLTVNAVIVTMGFIYNSLSFIFILLGSVFIIHIGRFLKNLSFV